MFVSTPRSPSSVPPLHCFHPLTFLTVTSFVLLCLPDLLSLSLFLIPSSISSNYSNIFPSLISYPACLSSLSFLSVCVGMSLSGSAPACPHFMLIGPAVPLKFTMATTTRCLATLLFSLSPSQCSPQAERGRKKDR